ncbi:AMP-binding protein [Hymenobacter setariae]|uniref:AMP-binding protein n=1 Tax=Hymenobacter setariae TaxID=2594794 RepID=A0A558C475_9BACT|nr:AMP-binding protein [Hymenobacter setariae]TVT43497.1 AMP-binding protein [Hymenobacter setariae]
MLLAPALPLACPPLPPPAAPALHPNFAERLYKTLGHHSAQEVLRWPATQPGATPHSVSGAALLARVQAWQQALEATGPLPLEAPVLLAHHGSPELVAALLAVLGLGGVPVLPPAGAGVRMLYHLLKAERIALALVAPSMQRRLGWLGRLIGCRCVAAPAVPNYDEWAAPKPDAVAAPVLRAVRPEQPALISHSSGSTSGRPAAVRRSHRVLQAQHDALRTQFPPWPGQRDFPLFPNVILHNLAVGALSIVPDLPGGKLAQLDPARVVTQLVAERIETLTGNVFYFEQLLAYLGQQPATFPGVRALGVGGSPVPELLLVALRRCFPRAVCHVIYGASEAEPIAVRTVAGPALDPRLGYCVGQPHAGLAIRLHEPQPVWQPDADATRTALGALTGPPRYQAGEVLVRGPHVAAAPGAWLPTGDFGYFDAAGQLWLTGRRGAAALVRGVGHYQLEHYLRQLPGVTQVAALPRPDGAAFDVLVAGSITAAAVQAASATAFGPGLVGQVTFRARLPVDGRHFSKIRYDLLC